MLPTQEQIATYLSRLHPFRGLTPDKLVEAAKLLEAVEIEPDQFLYNQGDDPDYFYFVYDGRVKMTRRDRPFLDERMLGFLDESDFFGFESLEDTRQRKSSVRAVTATIVLRLDIPGARQLFEKLPSTTRGFRLALESFNLSLKVEFPWVNPEEFIYFVARKHRIFLWLRLLPWIVAALVGISILGGLLLLNHALLFIVIDLVAIMVVSAFILWHSVDWANDYYIITPRRLADQERVVLLYESRQESPLEQIQSIAVDSTQVGRLMDYGDVVIRTFTGTLIFRKVAQPQEVVALIQELQKRSQSSMRQAELRQIETILKQRINPPPPKPPAPAQAVAQSAQVNRLQRFIADMFHLRYEFGDSIQYRTHWWILIGQIWFQSVLLLGMAGLLIWLFISTWMGKLNGFPVLGMGMGLCLLMLLVFLWLTYNYVDWHNDVYLLTSEQVIDINKKPLGKEIKRAAPIKNIISVEYARIGLIGLLLNFGTVYIRIGETNFTFDNVYNPSEVQREIFLRMSQRTLKERQMQGEADRQRLAEWIAAYHRITHP